MFNRTATSVISFVLVALAIPATALAVVLVRKGRAKPRSRKVIATAAASNGVPEIGALYAPGAAQHTCTASVVGSRRGDVLVTAAHCVAGNGAGMVFAPEQRGQQEPYGRWVVTAAYVEPGWRTGQDPETDIAFLTVAPQTIDGVRTQIEQVTGGYRLGPTAVGGQHVTITGYPAGSVNDPITCRSKVYLTRTYPTFDCRGFVDGTSGAPWLAATRDGAEIVGVIGGLNQGGCYDYTSFSSPLTADASVAYVRATENLVPGDVVPQAGGDGC